MWRRIVLMLVAAMITSLAASCESPEAPAGTGGRIVLRFDPGTGPNALTYGGAAVFDSVVVNVFRAGSPLRREVSRGAAITGVDPVDVTVRCIAEKGKKVGVDLYIDNMLVYHGYDASVDVIADVDNAVTIDAYAFYIGDMALAPGVVPDGAAFTLSWPPAAGAASYLIESSATLDFAAVASTQSAPDTIAYVHAEPGSHFFRVRASTPYANGVPSPPQFGYVTGGANGVQITGVSAAVVPGETISITGENLDFPGTTATIGAVSLVIESATWGEIVARVPRNATTAPVTVTSTLGSDTSDENVVVQRVAYVAGAGTTAPAYLALLATHADDVGLSGAVVIPVAELDARDMGVFDIVIVGSDTGAWTVSRAATIAATRANVLALGDGGLSFLRRAISALGAATAFTSNQNKLYTETKSAELFTAPHRVTGSGLGESEWISVSQNNQRTVALEIKARPTAAGLYACTGTGLLGVGVNDQWALFDYELPDVFSPTKRYVFWGYTADPADFTATGSDLFGNVMHLLYEVRAPSS